MKNSSIIMSHAYIIASNNAEAREKSSAELAQTLVCDEGGDSFCGVCPQCRRAATGVHPDIIIIDRTTDDKGKLRREIYVDQIRAMSADVWVCPQQANRKVYVIREAGLMNTAAQNAALKILEEPPAYAVFVLCAGSAQELLPTVRSRCVLIRAAEDAAEKNNEQACGLVEAALSGDEARLLEFCCGCEALDSDKSAELINDARIYISRAICGGCGDIGCSVNCAVELLKIIDTAAEYLKMNVGAKHVWGYISVSAILK
ncbi:MAG: hypothetical protein EOM14_05775 [Clostridia bacterium]|nr:hypothetical protein [Clostridia bacterium]